MYKIKYMAGVKKNLRDITKHLDGVDSRLSDRILDAISERILSLQESPNRYPRYLYNQKYRWTGVKNYMVFYKVIDDMQVVEIHRVLHGSQDIESLIKD